MTTVLIVVASWLAASVLLGPGIGWYLAQCNAAEREEDQ